MCWSRGRPGTSAAGWYRGCAAGVYASVAWSVTSGGWMAVGGPAWRLSKATWLTTKRRGRALDGIDVAYYLVHSMASGETFPERDRQIAQTFAAAARRAGVRRIVYLGGLGDPAQILSEHLISRQEVGRILAASGVPVIEFRAAVIVGSGSVSFEMIRYLTERLPVMITPRWVDIRCQPIGVRNVLEYLIEALDHPDAEGIYEIGGPDVLSYRQMMVGYARVRGLRRLILAFPVPHPEWSSRFIDLVTPIPYADRAAARGEPAHRDGGARRPRRPRVQRAADGLSAPRWSWR